MRSGSQSEGRGRSAANKGSGRDRGSGIKSIGDSKWTFLLPLVADSPDGILIQPSIRSYPRIIKKKKNQAKPKSQPKYVMSQKLFLSFSQRRSRVVSWVGRQVVSAGEECVDYCRCLARGSRWVGGGERVPVCFFQNSACLRHGMAGREDVVSNGNTIFGRKGDAEKKQMPQRSSGTRCKAARYRVQSSGPAEQKQEQN